MKSIKPIDIIIFLFVALFIYAATSKLMEYDRFEAQIGKSPLIMDYAELVAWLVPSSEIITAIILLIPALRIIGLYASFTIMLMFSLYIAFIMTFSPYVPCSCGGILNNMGWTEHLIFNIVFTTLAIFGIIFHNKDEAKKAETNHKLQHAQI